MTASRSLRIVFLGTPEFAVASLDRVRQSGHRIVGVITAPDKPAGRGYRLQASAVKTYALAHDLPLLQPTNLKDPEFLEALRAWQADLQIVVAFRMLPEVVWAMPPLGTFNLHASLLPQYRGAAPIQWAIMNGETETGVTTFFLQHAIDTGNIIAQQTLPIGPDDRADQVHDGLMALGAGLVAETVEAIAEDRCTPTPQSELADQDTALKIAPKLFKEHGRLNWNRPVQELHNHIRGLSPYPGAWTELHNADRTVLLKVFRAAFEQGETQVAPGSLITTGRNALKVAGADGFIHLHEVQLAGKKRLPVADFLAGFQADAGWTAG